MAPQTPAKAPAPKDSQDKPKLFPLRKRTGTAAFHLSTKAVDLHDEDLIDMSEEEAVMFLANVTWGSTKEMCCPHCCTFDEHYFYRRELRWKCKACDKKFSVTSGTVFADRKLPVRKILRIAFLWSNTTSGSPALQIRRNVRAGYQAIYTTLHKLREGLVRGFNTGALAGTVEMDGADTNGYRYREKRNRPQGGGGAPKPKLPAHLLKPPVDPETGEILFEGPPKPVKHGKAASQPLDRRLLLVMRQRGVAKGRGAVKTRVAVAITESKDTVTTFACHRISAESVIVTDEDPAYAGFGKLFAGYRSIAHSKAFSDRKGTHNNHAESYNQRMRRAENIYKSISNKYLFDYAVETAWREDARAMSTGDKFKNLLGFALSVGTSKFWRGYSKGTHRTVELLVEGFFPTKGRGRPKGWEPAAPR
ncbi:transposase [Aquabacterium sp.]|uniref:transposase n=1 Tax=Aquabacterium sp. TaxID=1872578 RepID=UPI0035C75B74